MSKRVLVKGDIGQAVGTVGGAVSGAARGAALGSIVPGSVQFLVALQEPF